MSDAWLTLTDEQLRDEVIATGQEATGLPVGPSYGATQGEWETLAMTVQRLFIVAVRPIAESADPRRATGLFLRLHGLNAAAPFRAAAGATEGYMHVTSATGGRMRAGTVVEAATVQFATLVEARLPAGEATPVAIRAEVAGEAGNIAAGTAVEFDATPTPADAVAELRAQWVTVVGFDADDVSTPEGSERYRPRVLAGMDVRGEANTLARYRFVALGVPGVSSVGSARAPRGYGSADISTLFEGQLPTEAQLDLVRAALARAGLVTRDVRATAPAVVNVAVNVSITGTASLTETEDAIDGWWRSEIGIGDGVLVQSLYASAHLGVEGIESIVYSSPSQNLLPAVNRWYQPSITVVRA